MTEKITKATAGPKTPENPLLAVLRQKRPASIGVTLGNGQERKIKVPNQRKRWEKVVEILDGLDVAGLELFDADGNTLGILGQDGGEEDTAAVGTNAGITSERGELLQLLTAAQEMALRHHTGAMQTLVDGYRTLTSDMGNRLSTLEKMYGRMLEIGAVAATNPTNGEDTTEEGIKLAGAVLREAGLLGNSSKNPAELPAKGDTGK